MLCDCGGKKKETPVERKTGKQFSTLFLQKSIAKVKALKSAL